MKGRRGDARPKAAGGGTTLSDGEVDGRRPDRGRGREVFRRPDLCKARASSAKPPGRPRASDDMTVVDGAYGLESRAKASAGALCLRQQDPKK